MHIIQYSNHNDSSFFARFRAFSRIGFFLGISLASFCTNPTDYIPPDDPAPNSNRAPEFKTISSDISDSILAQDSFSFDLRASDLDGDSISFAFISTDSMSVERNRIRWTPALSDTGEKCFRIRVADPAGLADTLAFCLQVWLENHPPSLISTPGDMTPTVILGSYYHDTVAAEDADNNLIYFAFVDSSAGMALKNGVVTWKPQEADTGRHWVSVRVFDATHAGDTLLWEILVTDTNHAPTFVSEPSNMTDTILAGDTLFDSVFVSDVDGDSLELRLLDGASGMYLSSANTVFTWAPTRDHAGTHNLSLQASDAAGMSDTLAWKLFVNVPPIFAGDSSSHSGYVQIGGTYSDSLRVSDADGHPLSFGFLDSSAGMSITGGVFQWTPMLSDTGLHSVRIMARDDCRGYDTLSWVLRVNDPPVFVSTPDSMPDSLIAGISFIDSILVRNRDADTLSFTFLTRASDMSITRQHLYWLVQATDTGTQSISLRVADNHGGVDTLAWTTRVVRRGYTLVTDNAAFGARSGHRSLVLDGKMWVIGGRNSSGTALNDVWYSTDGAAWTQATASAAFPARYMHAATAYDGKMWVVTGQTGTNVFSRFSDVWHSNDGIAWTQTSAAGAFGKRSQVSLLVFGGKMWLVAGIDSAHTYRNDVWNSTDGITWAQVEDSTAFLPRAGCAADTFAGKMWLMSGGHDNDLFLTEVWSSSNGIAWTKTTTDATAPFAAGLGVASAVLDGRLWLIGGFAPNYLDAWSSLDGTTWSHVVSDVDLNPRSWHTCVVFGSKIYAIAGGPNNSPHKDVRSYP